MASRHFSPFNRGPDDHDPPPPYIPPGGTQQAGFAAERDVWQNEQNEANERQEQRHHAAPSIPALRQQSNGHQTQTSWGTDTSTQPPSGPFYSAVEPPSGPFYPSNGSTGLPPAPLTYPDAASRTTPEHRGYPNLHQRGQPPSGPLYGGSSGAAYTQHTSYNTDLQGVASYGSDGGTSNTLFNAMPSNLDNVSLSSKNSSGRSCCNIL